jgi:hypothetical protein
MELVKNREGWLVGETHRQCTNCLEIYENKSKTVTLCGTCNSTRVKGQSDEIKMWRRAKARVTKSGVPFDIEISDIIIPEFCPILGIPLVVHKGRAGGEPNSPALDRVDNTLGYVKGNIMVISHLANMMKSSADPEQLIKFAEWVLTTYQQPSTLQASDQE